jgi:hypothetical protein
MAMPMFPSVIAVRVESGPLVSCSRACIFPSAQVHISPVDAELYRVSVLEKVFKPLRSHGPFARLCLIDSGIDERHANLKYYKAIRHQQELPVVSVVVHMHLARKHLLAHRFRRKSNT